MQNKTFMLTTKDFSILEAMCDNPLGRHDLVVPLMRQKMAASTVVFREDLPAGIASINSRIRFRVNGASDMRVLSTGQVTAPVGMFMPITTIRGVALLGAAEGQEIVVVNADGIEERILLEMVEYQPEASLRERRALLAQQAAPPRQRPLLRIVSGGAGQMRPALSVIPDGSDDPGPSAA